MGLLGSIYAGKHIEVCGEPAVILGDQASHEVSAGIWANSHQIAPNAFRARAPRYENMAGAKANAAAVKIEDGTVGSKPLQPRRLSQCDLGLGIHLGKGPVEAGQRRIPDKGVDQVLVPVPVRFGKQHRSARAAEGIREGRTTLKRLL